MSFIKLCFYSLVLILMCVESGAEPVTSKQAVEIAEATPEVQGLYKLNEGALKSCIERKVVRPCDSGWVTCIEEAWVVQYSVGEACGIKHDGRLSINLLIDEKDGRIISRYPEADYFQTRDFCREDYECLAVSSLESLECLNFIHGQVGGQKAGSETVCVCIYNQCHKND